MAKTKKACKWDTKGKKLYRIARSLNYWFLVFLTGLIGVLWWWSLNKDNQPIKPISYVIIAIVALNVLSLVLVNIYGAIYAKSINNKKLMIYYILGSLPFLNIIWIWCSICAMMLVRDTKDIKKENNIKVENTKLNN
ncbi:hypothetical protein FJO69_02865 [[Mycoplasma] falconis]|uniref:Uncharacterized protein n=1 Tax=[Mycoplasma] falconis TaxID=92403 RepID=A0A501X861_9BACT|nr:hypothetical protein [[Mycoplasma] falconis]TPE56573.1 hypothetical protein FJO69_02865 [[Mycoplasma] falconis]